MLDSQRMFQCLVEKVEKNGSPPSVLVIIAALNEEEAIKPTLAELRLVLEDEK